MSDLRQMLIDCRPREDAGSRSSNRVDFQKNWALALLLKLHSTPGNYLLLCEHHEDVVVLDCPTIPTLMRCYQVKSTTSANWNFTKLTSRAKGKDGNKKNSILGKLFRNQITFGDKASLLCLVSNAPFKLKLAKSGKDPVTVERIGCNELDAALRDKIRKKLQEEHGLTDLPEVGAEFVFEKTNMPAREHDTFVIGRLSEFLATINPSGKFLVKAIHRTLFDEIRRRTNEENAVNSFDELKTHKGISRDQFDEILRTIDRRSSDMNDVRSSMEAALYHDGATSTEVLRLRGEWNRYEVERMDLSNLTLQNARRAADSQATTALKSGSTESTRALSRQIAEALHTDYQFLSVLYLQAITLAAMYEDKPKLSSTSAEPKA